MSRQKNGLQPVDGQNCEHTWKRFLPPENLSIFESSAILKRLIEAKSALSRLDGYLVGIPNQAILITSLGLYEAKESSQIENIVTTLDDLYSYIPDSENSDPAAKEVQNYSEALLSGFNWVKSSGVIRLNDLLRIQAIIKGNTEGIRNRPGTVIANQDTGAVVHNPPQDHDTIIALLENLLLYMNDVSQLKLDPLVQMAIFHSQFEAIHPFFDGNGRTGRILNVLYLVIQKQIQFPALYLSRYIVRHKSEYYRLLRDVSNNQNWEEWVCFFLDAVLATSQLTLSVIERMREQMKQCEEILRPVLDRRFSNELLLHLFKNPYTTVEMFAKDLNYSKVTARSYLNDIETTEIFIRKTIKKRYYYLNQPLLRLLGEERTQTD